MSVRALLWGEASTELLELSEFSRYPGHDDEFGQKRFPEDHALSLGSGGAEVTGMVDHFLREADVVCCLGASLTHSWRLSGFQRARPSFTALPMSATSILSTAPHMQSLAISD